MNKKELMKLTKAELLELAKTNGRYVEESMSKAQIVEILLESAEPAEQAEEGHLTEQPEEQQPANEQSEENPAEQKSADEHSDETLHEENLASDQGDSTSAETPTDKQPAETPSEENPSEENPSEENPSEEHSDEHPAKTPTDEHSDEQQVLRKKIAIAEELRRRQSRVGAGITKFAGSMQQVMKQEIANRAMKYGGVKSKILFSDDRKEALRKERDLRASRNK